MALLLGVESYCLLLLLSDESLTETLPPATWCPSVPKLKYGHPIYRYT